MRRAATLAVVLASGVVVAIIAAPVMAAMFALFFQNADIRGGVDFTRHEAISLNNAAENFATLFKDGRLTNALVRTIATSLAVAVVTGLTAMTAAYWASRVRFFGHGAVKLFAFAAYLTPPIILVVMLSALRALIGAWTPPAVLLAVGHCIFLFPLAYAGALGHWSQGGFEFDRSAACDGADFFSRAAMHLAPRSTSNAFMLGLMLLTFMLSWSDVIFSRFLLLGEPNSRLLTDVVLDILSANEVVQPRAQLAAISVTTMFVAAVAAAGYGRVLGRSLGHD